MYVYSYVHDLIIKNIYNIGRNIEKQNTQLRKI